MARRSGLGKGLEALIPTDSATGPGVTSGLAEIAISAVVANRYQPRTSFDEEGLSSLTESIRTLGVLQPILVRRAGDEYELIAGERRWRAAKRAGLATIPAVIKEAEDVNSLEQAVVENLHREDLNPLEEAAAYQQLIEDFGLTQEQAAGRVGKSRSSVANLLRLFQLPPTVQKYVRDGQLSLGHAKVLLGTPDRAFQEHVAKRIVRDQLTVRETEAILKARAELEAALDKDHPSDPTPDAESDTGSAGEGAAGLRPPGLMELEGLLSTHLDTRVQVQMGGKRGRVVIEFANLEDLERIYRIISG